MYGRHVTEVAVVGHDTDPRLGDWFDKLLLLDPPARLQLLVERTSPLQNALAWAHANEVEAIALKREDMVRMHNLRGARGEAAGSLLAKYVIDQKKAGLVVLLPGGDLSLVVRRANLHGVPIWRPEVGADPPEPKKWRG